jgi:hydroxyacid-oxoacid transhydrogenase
MRDIEIPNGIAAVGYRESDIGDLVDGTMKQQQPVARAVRVVSSTGSRAGSGSL